jgi:hypothetical protein
MAFVMCVNANGQQRFEDGIYHRRETNSKVFKYLEFNKNGFVKSDYNMGFNIGICGYFKHSYIGYCCGGEVYNISVEVAAAGEGKGEHKYGNGGLSNDYIMLSTMIGYVSYLKCSNNTLLIINPKIGFCSESQLYNDKYYGSAVANSVGLFEVGADIGVWCNYFMVKVGITNLKINAQIGFSMLF